MKVMPAGLNVYTLLKPDGKSQEEILAFWQNATDLQLEGLFGCAERVVGINIFSQFHSSVYAAYG